MMKEDECPVLLLHLRHGRLDFCDHGNRHTGCRRRGVLSFWHPGLSRRGSVGSSSTIRFLESSMASRVDGTAVAATSQSPGQRSSASRKFWSSVWPVAVRAGRPCVADYACPCWPSLSCRLSFQSHQL